MEHDFHSNICKICKIKKRNVGNLNHHTGHEDDELEFPSLIPATYDDEEGIGGSHTVADHFAGDEDFDEDNDESSGNFEGTALKSLRKFSEDQEKERRNEKRKSKTSDKFPSLGFILPSQHSGKKTPKDEEKEKISTKTNIPESPSAPPPTPELLGKNQNQKPKPDQMQREGQIVGGLHGLINKSSFQSDVERKVKTLTIGHQQAEIEVILDYLVENHKNKDEALLYVVKEVHPEVMVQQLVTALLQRGAAPTKYDADKRSVVFYAVQKKYTQVLNKVLEAKGRPNTKDIEGKFPLQIALEDKSDDIAALLIAYMPNDVVRRNFCSSGKKPSKYNFHKVLKSNMNQTILVLLDCLLEKTTEGDVEVYYHMLECDDHGRSPKNSRYKKAGKSALELIAETQNKDAIFHNVVRLLLRKKWKSYGRMHFIFGCFLFLISLAIITFALIVGATTEDPLIYNSALQYARAVAEIITIVILLTHLVKEVMQMYRRRCEYIRDMYNILDLSSIVFLLISVPLRFTVGKHSWPVMGIGYFLWSMRTFKYSAITSETGAFARILWIILTQDIMQFMAVFMVVLLAFSGLLMTGLAYDGTMFQQWETKSYWITLLSGARTLIEQQPIIDPYVGDTGLGVFSAIVMFLFLFITLVVLLNILIARLSDTYQHVQKDAKRGLEMNRAKIITRLERQTFLSNPRKDYYVDSEKIINGAMDDWMKWDTSSNSDRMQILVALQNRLEEQDLYLRSMGQRIHQCWRTGLNTHKTLMAMEKKLAKLLQEDEQVVPREASNLASGLLPSIV